MTTRKSRLTSGLFSSTTDLWATPQAFFDELNREFHFNLDPCANAENHKCEKYFTEADDGLKQSWGGIVSSAIRPMAGRLPHGSGSATRRAASRARLLSCLSLHGRTHHISTTTSTIRPSCASSVAACISMRHRRAHRSLRWSWYSRTI